MKTIALFLLLSSVSMTRLMQKQSRIIEEKINGFTFKVDIQGESELQSDTEAQNQESEQTEVARDPEIYPNSLRWDHTVEEIQKLTQEIIKHSNKTMNDIAAAPEPRTFENTVAPMAQDDHYLSTKTRQISFYSQVSTNKEIREAAKEFEKQIGEFQTDQSMRDDTYQAFKNYFATAKGDGSFDMLDKESQRYITKQISDCETGGLKLPPEQRNILKQKKKEIAELGKKANSNINEDKSQIALSDEELEGLPDKQKNQLKLVEGKPGYRYLKLEKNFLGESTRHLKRGDTRKKINFAVGQINKKENIPILEKLVSLRQEVALMLGFSSYSEYVLQDLMAKNATNVQKFEDEMYGRVKDMHLEEMEQLKKIKQEDMKDPKVQLNPWDHGYYSAISKKKLYDIDEETLKEYFPAEHVKQATLEIYQELLGLDFKILPKAQTWEKAVTCYEVKDKESKKILGHFYLDLFPRPDKFNHAAAFTLLKRAQIGDEIALSAAAMVTNFNPPVGDQPSLLKHQQVVTFFHEFGHVMHNLCSEAKFSRFSATSVERDFVEMPSQMLENWIWDKDILKKVSKHYKTGQPLPDKVIEQKIKSVKHMAGTSAIGQIYLASMDFLLYSASDKNLLKINTPGLAEWRHQLQHKPNFAIDTEHLTHFLASKIEGETLQEGTNTIGAFGHIIGGYESQYYSYLWSQVYSCDLFSQFKKAGLLNKEIGMRYRKIILAPGGSRDSIDSLKKFLGREPNNKAFLEQNNFNHIK